MPQFGKISPVRIAGLPFDGGSIAGPLEAIGKGLQFVGEEAERIQKETDNLAILKAKNEAALMRAEFDKELRESGNYQDADTQWGKRFNKFRQQRARTVSSLSSDAFAEAFDREDLLGRLQTMRTSDELRARDIENEAQVALTSLIQNAFPSQEFLQSATPEVIALTNTIPLLTEGERSKLAQTQLHKLYMTAADRLVLEDPQRFLKEGPDLFKDYLGGHDIANLRNKARGLVKARGAIGGLNTNRARKDLMDSVKDMVGSIAITGEPIDIDIVGRLNDLGFTKDAEKVQSQIDNAYRVYKHVSQLKGTDFRNRLEEVAKLKPEPGARYFSSQQEVYTTAVEVLQKKIKAYTKDPAAYVTRDAESLSQLSGKSPYEERVSLQVALGTPAYQAQIYTNDELTKFEDEYKTALPEVRAGLITAAVSMVPTNLQSQAINQLPISALDKFAYMGAEDVGYRRNIMLSASSFNEKQLIKAEREKIQEQIEGYITSDDTPLSYYNDMANYTGDVSLRITADAAKGLVAKTAYYLTDKRIENPLEASTGIVFGKDVSFVSNDIVIGRNTSVFQIDDNVQALLAYKRRWELGPVPEGYDPEEWRNYSMGLGARWVLRGDQFILYDKDKQKIIPSYDQEPITFSIIDIVKRLEEAKDKELPESDIVLMVPNSPMR